MGTTKTIEKNVSAEMFSPSVSPSAVKDGEVKKSVELALQDFTPKNRVEQWIGLIDSIGCTSRGRSSTFLAKTKERQ